MSTSGPVFEDSWAELVTIRTALEEGRVGVGSLATTLARARHLVATCRGHLRAATIAVEEFARDAQNDTSDGGTV